MKKCSHAMAFKRLAVCFYLLTANSKTANTPLWVLAVLAEMEGFVRAKVSPGRYTAKNSPLDYFKWVQISPSIHIKTQTPPLGVFAFLAEMEGFEPPHALRRLADFESAPFSHLGTSPYWQLLYCSKLSPKKQELVLLSHQFQDIIHFSHNA